GDTSGTNVFAGFYEQQKQTVESDATTLTYRFQIKAPGGSLQFYRLAVRTVDGRSGEPGDEPPPPAEATMVNNDRLVMVDRGVGPYRILYVAGRPNWEFKFLNRALAEDDQLRLEGLIRIARREPKFEFKGRSGETSNPLFRGFGNQSADEIERYDQPVLIPLPIGNEKLRPGFPRSSEELYGYHAVIVDDLEAEFFKPDQLALLQKFVSERGGGFMMLGGQESFQEGGYDRTPVGNMLPVYLRQVPGMDEPGGAFGNFRLDLTREGWIQPWARVRSRESDEQARLSALPPMQVLNTVSGIKPGASVVATVTGANGSQYPALVVQRYGSGRTASMLIGDFWMTGRRDEQQQEDQAKTWRQIARWLVTDVPEQITIANRLDPLHAGSVQLSVRVRDREFKPMDGASVKLTVRKVTGEGITNQIDSIQLTGEPMAAEPGLFTASYVQHGSGGYHA
ncbi:MAG TPA: hypothetical protein DCY13_23840, partial [Verrucomicrobiales bacterium]|nr:hypothetical protein [Verrucomicrobiales bacterium]